MVFGQPMEKSRKNIVNLLPNFRTNSKVLVHPDMKIHKLNKIKIHNTITI